MEAVLRPDERFRTFSVIISTPETHISKPFTCKVHRCRLYTLWLVASLQKRAQSPGWNVSRGHFYKPCLLYRCFVNKNRSFWQELFLCRQKPEVRSQASCQPCLCWLKMNIIATKNWLVRWEVATCNLHFQRPLTLCTCEWKVKTFCFKKYMFMCG